WNKVVFSEVVPKAWLSLLGYLVEHKLNVYDAWPDLVASQDGDHGYWYCVPRGLLTRAAFSAVWPAGEGESQRTRLVEVLVASDEDGGIPVDALRACRLPFITVPERLLAIIKSSEFGARVLTPRTAGPYLVKNVKTLSGLRNPATKNSLCEYLLSTGDIGAIFGLPLLPTVQGDFISLTPKLPHVMATERDAEVFKDVAPTLLAADFMSPSTRELLLEKSSGRIYFIGPAEVAEYLQKKVKIYEGQRAATVTNTVNSNDVQWLIKFWAWLDQWDQRDAFMESNTWTLIHKLHALPLNTSNDRPSLRQVEGGALRPEGIKPQVLASFSLLEIPVLHLSLSSGPAVQQASKSTTDIPFILQNVGNLKAVSRIQPGYRASLHHFFVSGLSSGTSALEASLREFLRDLPIFPTLQPGVRNERSFSYSTAPQGTQFVNDSVRVVPVVRGKTFVLYSQAKVLSTALGEKDVADEIAILGMVVDPMVWRQQPAELLPPLIDRMIRRLSDFNQATRNGIASLEIIDVGEPKIRKSPKFVVDPSSEIAELYGQKDQFLP
ncbi:hypothetical protein FRC01_013055, partial [Tulasnella sp. 417]